MEMTIDLAIKVLKRMIKKGIAYDDGYAFEPLSQDEEKACSIAIDTINRHQMMQADYENRLKADMVDMLTEIQLEIDSLPTYNDVHDIADYIQEKINALKGGEDGKQ